MSGELLEFAPLWILVIGALALLLADAYARAREPGFLRNLALIVVACAFVAAFARFGAAEHDLGRFALSRALLTDHLALACDLLALLALFGVIALAEERRGRASSTSGTAFGEREPLLLLAGAGALTCIHAGDLLVMWLGVELLGIAALLTSFADPDSVSNRHRRAALLGHMIPAAIVSCLMLLGIALIYAALGTTSLDGFARAATKVFAQWGGTQRWVTVIERYGAEIAEQDPAALQQARSEIVHGLAPAALFLPGVLLVLAGLLTKLGLLPFARRRELVEQAPLHASALWSTLATVALTAVLLRVYAGALNSPRLANEPYGWTGALPTVALLTGVWASVAALRQRRLSRAVALLSAVQVSLLLLGIVAATSFHGHIGVGARYLAPEYETLWARLAGDEAVASVLILLVAHVIAALGCFAALAANRGAMGPELRMQNWSGMAKRRPQLALVFAVCLLSLVGLPPLAGFVGKLGILRALAEHSEMRWMIAVVALELGVCACVVVRVIAAMLYGDEAGFALRPRPEPEPSRGEASAPERDEREQNPWPLRVATLAAALSLLFGLGGQGLIVFARLPAAGSSFEAGDPDRLDWLEQRRATWAVEDAAALEDEAETEGETAETEADTEGALDPADRRSVEPAR
jgi:NADH-quinone oxidoreductase subunit N